MSNGEINQRCFKVKDAVRYLGVSPWRIRRAIARREIKHFRWRKFYMLDRQDLDRFVDDLKQKSAAS